MPASNREFLPRGVWKAPFLQDGHEVAIAVDSRRRRLGFIVLFPHVDRAEVKRMLTQLLEWCDPQPKLALVADRSSEELPPLSPASYALLNRHRA